MRKRYLAMLLVTLCLTIWLWVDRARAKPDPRVLPDSAVNHAELSSNILPEDYVGPDACAKCHKQKHTLWAAHPHARMNQLPTKESVQGDFTGDVLELPTGTVTFTTEGDAFLMTVTRNGHVLRRYRVTRTVGSRYVQYYIGVQTEGPEPADSGLYREHMLPFTYHTTEQRWLPKHYLDPDGDEKLVDGIPQTEGIDMITDIRPYSKVCMNCHNTFPYAYRIFHDKFVGFNDALVAAAIGPLSEALSSTIPVGRKVKDFQTLNSRLDPDRHLVTLGISCESCHFGGREHVENPEKVHFLPISKFIQITSKREDRPVTDSRKSAATVNGICTQCHSGGGMLFPNGGAQCNSREGCDFGSGACASQMSCASCHEPHTAGPRSGGPTEPAHLAVCTQCHTRYAEPEKARVHSRHADAQANCLDCHMPRQTIGVETLVRTHRVSAPVEPIMVNHASANACNLCHLDRSLRWTLTELERGWGKRIAPSPNSEGLAVLDQPMGPFWLKGKATNMRLVAAQSYARSPLGKAMLPELLKNLNDPEPMNRVFTQQAVEKLLGHKLPRTGYRVTASPADRLAQIDRLLTEIRATGQ
jgi:hypothetical protein